MTTNKIRFDHFFPQPSELPVDIGVMDEYTAILTDKLFSATGNQWNGLETLANQALSSGIDKYQNKDYEGAAIAFKRAFGLSPYSDFAYEATKYASMAFQALGQTDQAIAVYEQAIKVNSTDDRLHLDMGNLLFGEEQYGEAIEHYEEAVRLYDDSTNRFSLGQAYLKTGRYNDAENQFEKIVQRGGLESRNGYFGLGQTYKARKNYTAAIGQFERAIAKDRDFYNAYAEMGYTYADMGDMDKAQDMVQALENKDAATADTLERYINKVTQPKIMFAYADSSFKYYLKPKSALSALDSYLANAGASQTFSLKFQFTKEMDRDSVQDIFNWSILRSTETDPGMRYNNGLSVPSTEINVPLYPLDVYYDQDTLTAKVRFQLTQNDSADGTIDPSHIVISFSGVDADGNRLDADYDQFMGFSGSF
jgi:tetratricopeptide (TPR) repeat protein